MAGRTTPSIEKVYRRQIGKRMSSSNIRQTTEIYRKALKDLEATRCKVEFYESLIRAVVAAGGRPDWITESTTLSELAESLAPNGVVFSVNKPTIR